MNCGVRDTDPAPAGESIMGTFSTQRNNTMTSTAVHSIVNPA